MEKVNASKRALLDLTDSQLSAVVAVTGSEVFIDVIPFVGRYLIVDGVPVCGHNPEHPDLEFSYELASNGRYTRVYVGAAHTGPLVSWTEDGFCNLYGHGNHGKNGACGGTWSADGKKCYKTLKECLENRDYEVSGLKMHKSRLKEGPALIEALLSLA